jgi:DeoR/GlpR family transcriptional regulator of sugar metabolism
MEKARMPNLEGAPGNLADSGERRPSRRRRELIRARVVEAGSVRIEDLAAEFGVTAMTIHRDLNVLETQGWLRKVRGGATVDISALVDTTVRHRLTDKVAEKQEIARCALRYVDGADALILDDSTTALQLAHLLPDQAPLTVITNFLMAINSLVGKSGIELIALGGSYNATYDAFHGLQAREAISKLRADVVFMSTTAILDGRLYHKSEETILIRHAMMEAAARKILLADHSKFRRRATHVLAALTDFDVVIVDSGIDDRDLTAMREHGVHVEVAAAAHEDEPADAEPATATGGGGSRAASQPG